MKLLNYNRKLVYLICANQKSFGLKYRKRVNDLKKRYSPQSRCTLSIAFTARTRYLMMQIIQIKFGGVMF